MLTYNINRKLVASTFNKYQNEIKMTRLKKGWKKNRKAKKMSEQLNYNSGAFAERFNLKSRLMLTTSHFCAIFIVLVIACFVCWIYYNYAKTLTLIFIVLYRWPLTWRIEHTMFSTKCVFASSPKLNQDNITLFYETRFQINLHWRWQN